MLSKNDDKSFDLLQKITESDLADNPLKNMVTHLVSKFLEFTGGTNQNEESLNFTSPYKRKHDREEFSNPDSFMFLDKISVLENDLLCNVLLISVYKDLVLTQKQKLDDLEDANHHLKHDLESKSTQLEHLTFINKDFKEKANIGMLEFLEAELKNKENQLSGLHSRLDEKQKEYSNKLEHYQKIFEQNRTRVNELEEENHQLKQAPRQEIRQTQQEMDSEALFNNEQCQQLQQELQAEKEKCKALHADLFNEKSSLISLDIKYGDLERTIQEHELKIDDLEHTLHERQVQITKLEVHWHNIGFLQQFRSNLQTQSDLLIIEQ